MVVDALRAHRAAQLQERLASAAWRDDGLVFTTSIGTWIEPRNVLRSLQAACDRAEGRRVRIHDLRHAAASFMLLQGVDMRVVMGTLGHSRLATTSDLHPSSQWRGRGRGVATQPRNDAHDQAPNAC